MKKINVAQQLSLFVFLFLSTTTFLSAQVQFGFRGGLSTDNFKKEDILVEDADGHSKFKLGLKEADYGYHFGGFARIGSKKLYVQPELVFNASSIQYSYDSLSLSSISQSVLSEKHHRVDLPVMFGYKFGALNIHGGPVAHFHINSSSELTDIEGFKEKFDTFTYGYQAGLGLDIWKLLIDLRYEGNFSKRGDHFSFFGKDYSYDSSPSRLLLSVGFHF